MTCSSCPAQQGSCGSAYDQARLVDRHGRTDLKRSTELGEDASWWYDDGRLYWVFLRPVTSGAGSTAQLLGFLAVGYQVDSAVAQQLAIAAGNQIALTTSDTVIASTLPARDEAGLQRRIRSGTLSSANTSGEISLETDQYVFSSVSAARIFAFSSALLRPDAAGTRKHVHQAIELSHLHHRRAGGALWSWFVRVCGQHRHPPVWIIWSQASKPLLPATSHTRSPHGAARNWWN